jgi:hypothetical protein
VVYDHRAGLVPTLAGDRAGDNAESAWGGAGDLPSDDGGTMSDAEATEHALWVIELLIQQGFDPRSLMDERDRRIEAELQAP